MTDKPQTTDANDTVNDHVIGKAEQSIEHFFEAMKAREAMSIRIGKRTTLFVRFTMVALVVVSILLFQLINALTHRMEEISDHMIDVNRNMRSMIIPMQHLPAMSGNVTRMANSVTGMQQSVYRMTESIGSIEQNVRFLPSMQKSVATMNQQMQQLNQHMGSIDSAVNHMTRSMSRMNYDVNRIARPMGMIPFGGP